MYLDLELVGPIAEHLQRYFQSQASRITGFRAGIVRLLNDDTIWPVVEWRENLDTDVLAVFKVTGSGAPCGYLMHYGEGLVWQDHKRWRRSFIAWQVVEMGDLGDLFVVVQHILGMLYWSDKDLVNPCLKDCRIDCSDDQ
jgi:hypothetical protein